MMTKQEELATRKDLEKLEDRLTAKIGANAAKIDANSTKIEANGKKIDANAAKIDANAAKIDQVEKNLSAKIDANSQTLSRLTSLVLDNGERMATKENMNKRLDEIVSGIDGLARSFSILQQERVVTNNRLDRIEARLA